MTAEAIVYRKAGVTEYDDIEEAKAAVGTTWVQVTESTTAELNSVATIFGIHPLTIEDIVNGVRPKTEEFPSYTFTLIHIVELALGETRFEEEIKVEPVGLFIGPDWVVTMTFGSGAPVDRVWRSVNSRNERLLERGPDFTAYRILDVIIDEYFTLLDRIGDQIEAIEDEVLVSTDIRTLESINNVRRDLLSFRKTAWPTREALGVLARGDPTEIQERNEKYYRDVYDHLVQVVDFTETYRDLVTGARDIYLNTVSQNTNEVMKVLTVIATVFLPLTFLVGIYGMNFDGGPFNMPELEWTFGYPAVMISMGFIALLMLAYFREKDYV